MFFLVASQENWSDKRIHGDILLNIKRATVSSSKCVHPLCMARQSLHVISIGVRLELMKELRFYVPSRGLVCKDHRVKNQWNETDIENIGLVPFTVSHIEDMVDLLRFQPKKLDYMRSGIHSSYYQLFCLGYYIVRLFHSC